MRKIPNNFSKLWELNPLWALLTPDQRNYIDDNAEIRRFRKNDMIHKEGDASTHIMMVVSGTVRLYKEGIGGRVQIMRFLKPYDLFGYRGAILGRQHTTSASVMESGFIYFVRREAFVQMLRQNHEFCFSLMELMTADLATTETNIVNLTQKHLRGRLAEALLTLRDTYGYDEDGITLSIFMSREDLANMSNMTTANAIRTLSQFASEGIVSIDGKKIKILNPDSLMHISQLG